MRHSEEGFITTYKRRVLEGKHFGVFLSKTTIKLYFKWEFNPQMHIYRTFFPKIRTLQNQGTFFPCFEIGQGRSSPIPLVMHLLALIIE